MAKLRQLPLHTLLLALYPTLALVAANINETRPATGLRALAAGVLLAGLLLLLCKAIFKDWLRAGLAASSLLVFFFSYGQLYDGIKEIGGIGEMLGRHRYLLPLGLALNTAALVAIGRDKGNLAQGTLVTNVVSLGLVLFPLLQITNFELRDWLFERQERQTAAQASSTEGAEQPDVYYIIADAYARDDVLLDTYGYDNRLFLDRLGAMGFYVANCSRSNYPKTRLSLTSSLNLDYIENLGITANDQLDEFWRRIRRSVVRKTFEEQGYQIVALQTNFYWTEWTDADIYLSRESEHMGMLQRLRAFGALNSFESLLIRTTALRAALDLQPLLTESLIEAVDVTPLKQHYELVEFGLDALSEMVQIEGPKFVFAHLLIPHGPFVFDAEGNFTTTPGSLEEAYNAQVEYLNNRLLAVFEVILAESARPVVIILQGDHGAPGTQFSHDRMKILNAYYFPDAYNALYPSISPVNSFRLVFTTYFSDEYALLEDLSYYSTNEDFLDTTLVSDDRQGCPTD